MGPSQVVTVQAERRWLRQRCALLACFPCATSTQVTEPAAPTLAKRYTSPVPCTFTFTNIVTLTELVLQALPGVICEAGAGAGRSGRVSCSPSTEGIFFEIVEARTRDHRPILVTTNHSGAAMEKLFSENIATPLVRRLRDHCDCFAFEQGK
jgi:hypothetical protein